MFFFLFFFVFFYIINLLCPDIRDSMYANTSLVSSEREVIHKKQNMHIKIQSAQIYC